MIAIVVDRVIDLRRDPSDILGTPPYFNPPDYSPSDFRVWLELELMSGLIIRLLFISPWINVWCDNVRMANVCPVLLISGGLKSYLREASSIHDVFSISYFQLPLRYLHRVFDIMYPTRCCLLCLVLLSL